MIIAITREVLSTFSNICSDLEAYLAIQVVLYQVVLMCVCIEITEVSFKMTSEMYVKSLYNIKMAENSNFSYFWGWDLKLWIAKYAFKLLQMFENVFNTSLVIPIIILHAQNHVISPYFRHNGHLEKRAWPPPLKKNSHCLKVFLLFTTFLLFYSLFAGGSRF